MGWVVRVVCGYFPKFDISPAGTLDFCGWQFSLGHPRVYVRDGEGNVELCGLRMRLMHP